MAKSSKKHVIWSDMNLNLDDWRDDLLEENPGMSEDELYDEMCRVNSDYLDDENNIIKPYTVREKDWVYQTIMSNLSEIVK